MSEIVVSEIRTGFTFLLLQDFKALMFQAELEVASLSG